VISVLRMPKENKFCRLDDLKNEADVEQSFLRRLLESLGYSDSQIRPKESLTVLTVGGMRGQSANYRPDFALKLALHVRWIVEAKAPDEDLGKHIWQPRGYCTLLNGEYRNDNPVRYFLLSNAKKTRLYQWDINEPLIELDFKDFVDGNAKFAKLCQYVSAAAIAKGKKVAPAPSATYRLEKRPLEEVNAAFAWCHQHIHKKDDISQAEAFPQFVKVIFLKLLSDRRIREKYPNALAEEVIEVPKEDVIFSSHWIAAEEKNTPNPLDSIQFRDFINSMERAIEKNERKRIFDSDEKIDLSPETIRDVVKRVEHLFLFGIDVDLNGRLFETFLNATMRGKDLGQYFTPRSIVKLAVKLTNLRVNTLMPDGSYYTDLVLDGCCGTGGFLIDVLSQMWKKVDTNPALEDKAKEKLRKYIADHRIVGIDVGRKPAVARITRLNMYLHGDGGSGIYQVDALDKQLLDREIDSPAIAAEKEELRKLIHQEAGFADVVLTNPPFAKSYERNQPAPNAAFEPGQKDKSEAAIFESAILDDYDIGTTKGGGKRPVVKSSLMFAERYYDLLKVGGTFVTVIDDGILNGDSYGWFRDYLRSRFLIRAIVSLPGDAFQRSQARVKTSLLVAEKRDVTIQQKQPPVFMYGCEYVGIDDPARQRALPIDKENREAALKEIETVGLAYHAFLSGEGDKKYIVPAHRIEDRLDVKSCLMSAGRMVSTWTKRGVDVISLEELATPRIFGEGDTIETETASELVTYLRVTYAGYAERGDEIPASETTYKHLYRVRTGDVVISNIAASYGSIGIVPPSLDGCVVANEYTVLRALDGVSPITVWLLLRSPEARAEMLLLATGIARNRVKWETLKTLKLPRPNPNIVRKIVALTTEADKAEMLAQQYRDKARESIEAALDLNGAEALHILRAFKPPK
jgi:type I restriction enzyme M protein